MHSVGQDHHRRRPSATCTPPPPPAAAERCPECQVDGDGDGASIPWSSPGGPTPTLCPELSLESANSTARSVDPFASLAALRAASHSMSGNISRNCCATPSKLPAPAPTVLPWPTPLRLSASSAGVAVVAVEADTPTSRARPPGTVIPPPGAATPPPAPARPNRNIWRTMRTAESAPRAAREKPSGVGGRCTAGANASGLLWWCWCSSPYLPLAVAAVPVVVLLVVVGAEGLGVRTSPPAGSLSPPPPPPPRWWALGDGLIPPTEGCHGITVRQIGQSGSSDEVLLRYCRRQPV